MNLVLHTVPVLTFLFISWKISSTFRYCMKYAFFLASSLIGSTAPIPLMLPRPRDSRNALIPACIYRISAGILGLTYTVEGQENIVKDTGCVVLINHQSFLDIIVLSYLWPIMEKCTVISKKEILYLQPFGLAAWLWGTIFINRANSNEAKSKINKSEQAIRKNKSRILIFPEGTRHMGKELLPFKKGAFHLALEAKCPIQPVAVSRYTFLGKRRFDDGHIVIRILPAISTKNITKDELPKLMDKVYKTMSENVDLISTVENNK